MTEAGTEPERTEPPEAGGPEELWRRIKEHRIVQWTLGYVAIGYGIQHSITLTSEAYDWPHDVTRISMTLLALGLPLAMVLAWYHGERSSRRVSAGEMSLLSVLLVLVSLVFYLFVRTPEQKAATPPQTANTSTANARVAQQTMAGAPMAANAKSVAVLPFLNLSGDPKEEFFSDGMTEEITAALAKVPSLPVVARTSAFQFKNVNKDVRTICQTLGANYVIEGSVRKNGDQVRITAQLIRGADGDHVWVESYDRKLTNLFEVQEDVARAIATALQVPLGLKEGENLVSNRDIDLDSYQNYLRAKALIRSRGPGPELTASIALLEQVVALHPNYAPAWALLAQAYDVKPNYDPVMTHGSVGEMRRLVNSSLSKAEAAAKRAIQLDPRNADAYAALGSVQNDRRKPLEAEQSYMQALKLDPLDPETLQWYSILLGQSDRIQQAVAMQKQLRALEPLVPVFNVNAAITLLVAGDLTQALTIAETLPPDFSGRTLIVAGIYAEAGRYKDAADAILTLPRKDFPPEITQTAARLLRAAPAPATGDNIPQLGILSWVFVYAGLPARALEYTEHMIDAGFTYSQFSIFWLPDYAPVRKTERFKILVRKLGLVDYWRARGWPDSCHPAGAHDFACS
jgi:TolB-like protein/Flp pilus assembly protein TadD